MLNEVLRLLRTQHWVTILTGSLLLTSIGAGLTQVAVLGVLGEQRISSVAFAMMSVMSVAPALLSAEISSRLAARTGPFPLLLLSEVGGLLSLAVPWLAIRTGGNVQLLIASAFLPSLSAGLAVSAFGVAAKRFLPHESLGAIAAIDTVVFAATALLGTGLGAILFPICGARPFLIFDLSTYLVAIILICVAWRSTRGIGPDTTKEDVRDVHRPRMHPMESQQRRAFVLTPVMAIVTGPAMALLPALGDRFAALRVGGLVVAPVIGVVFARSVGQLLGPFMLPVAATRVIYQSNFVRASTLAFVGLYLVAFTTDHYWLLFFLVIFAHIVTNIVSTSSDIAVLAHFPAKALPFVMARRFQLQVVMFSLTGLLAAAIADAYSLVVGFVVTTLPASILFWFLLGKANTDETTAKSGTGWVDDV